jgi:hypothetical protein
VLQVLCHGNAMWQSASDGHVPEEALAAGMTKEGERLYVGRVFHDGTLTPGKVRSWEWRLVVGYVINVSYGGECEGCVTTHKRVN